MGVTALAGPSYSPALKTETETTKVEINFENLAAAQQFVDWLNGQGEQDYWTWMEYREQEESGKITATRFIYNDLQVDTKCGRLDKCE